MIITKNASAGVDSADDVVVNVEPAKDGLEIIVNSYVQTLFGDAIRETVAACTERFGVKNAKITVSDKGALAYVIDARTEAALLRAGEKK